MDSLDTKDIFIDKRLIIKRSKIDGADWGIFASDAIPKGTVIEKARTLKLKNIHLFQENNILNDYVFRLDDNHSLVVLGFGSLFNHSDDPHVLWKIVDNTMVYTTIKDIKPNEEIYISYGNDWFKNRKNTKNNNKSNQIGGYYEKYLKYKNKYINLKSKIN